MAQERPWGRSQLRRRAQLGQGRVPSKRSMQSTRSSKRLGSAYLETVGLGLPLRQPQRAVQLAPLRAAEDGALSGVRNTVDHAAGRCSEQCRAPTASRQPAKQACRRGAASQPATSARLLVVSVKVGFIQEEAQLRGHGSVQVCRQAGGSVPGGSGVCRVRRSAGGEHARGAGCSVGTPSSGRFAQVVGPGAAMQEHNLCGISSAAAAAQQAPTRAGLDRQLEA